MIDTAGMVTVAEAAKRLNRSIEQVRRKLREGKLKGHRIGNQWFVEEDALQTHPGKTHPLIAPELMAEVKATARRITEQNPGYTFDPVEMVRKSRAEH